MTQFLIVILYALLPAAGNLLGAVLAECVRPPKWVIGATLHGAAGIAIALISIELMPRVLDDLPMWGIVVAFSLGAATSVAMARGIKSIQGVGQRQSFRAWMVYAVIGADLFSDGLMTGAGTAVAQDLGLLLAGAQLFANVPGGFAATANLRQHRVTRTRRTTVAFLMFVPVILSALSGYTILRTAPEFVNAAAISFIIGVLLLATIEDMVPEGDAPRPPRWSSTLAFSLGFAGLALISQYL